MPDVMISRAEALAAAEGRIYDLERAVDELRAEIRQVPR